MNLTKALKGWLVENKYATDAATDEDCKAAVGKALAEGKLSPQKLAELTAEPKAEDDDPMKALTDAIAKAMTPIQDQVSKLATEVGELKKPTEKELNEEKSGLDGLADLIGKAVEKAIKPQHAQKSDSETTPAQMFGGNGEETKGLNVRVKSAVEGYSATKSAVHFPDNHKHFPGQRACFAGQPLDTSSTKDLAISGAFFKFAAAAGSGGRPMPRWLRMTEHDKHLVEYAMHEEAWSGVIGGDESGLGSRSIEVNNRKLTEFERKALLDDVTSGGIEITPVVFDSAIITTPVLFGELFPLVDVVPLARGRRVEGGSISNPTFTSGTAEGSEITAFTTDAMIAALDTTIYNAVGAIEIGRDFQEDSPVPVASMVTRAYGEKAMEWLDNQIANGDGTTEPQGLFVASGTTDIGNPAGGANAAPQITDYENLLFGLAKQYRTPAERNRCVFVANDTSYKRSRAIAVGATDQRRVFGMDHQSYMLLEQPYKVQNNIANTKACFANMRYYRMYRRLGLNVRVEEGGATLAQKNLTLIVVRMRWGGRLMAGAAMAYSDNWQT